jgi:hypothetical protein
LGNGRNQLVSAFVLILLVFGSWFIWFRASSPTPNGSFTASSFRQAVIDRNWQALYRQAPGGRAGPTLTEAQFVALLNSIAEELPAAGLQEVEVKVIGPSPVDPSVQVIEIVFPGLKDRGGQPLRYMDGVYDQGGKKHAAVNLLPFWLAKAGTASPQESYARIARAMDAARVVVFRSSVGEVTIDRREIDLFLAGQISAEGLNPQRAK